MQEDMEVVLERQTVLGKFLDRLNYRPLRYVYTLMNGLLSIIDSFLSSDEDCMSSLRASLLSYISFLARTFYQSSLVDNLRSGGKTSQQFKNQVERAYMKGLSEREQIIQKIEITISKAETLFRLKEDLNSKWQEIYYRTSAESSAEQNIRNNISLVIEKQDEYSSFHSPNLADQDSFKTQKESIRQISDLSFQAVDFGDKAQMTIHELLDLSINPLASIAEDEVSSAEKILLQIESDSKKKSKKLSEDEIGKLCDVLSWGLDDITNFDELIKLGKELRNEFASILSDFLVNLVDIDLGIQELESYILESSEH